MVNEKLRNYYEKEYHFTEISLNSESMIEIFGRDGLIEDALTRCYGAFMFSQTLPEFDDYNSAEKDYEEIHTKFINLLYGE